VQFWLAGKVRVEAHKLHRRQVMRPAGSGELSSKQLVTSTREGCSESSLLDDQSCN
jgi:hypothetical protein